MQKSSPALLLQPHRLRFSSTGLLLHRSSPPPLFPSNASPGMDKLTDQMDAATLRGIQAPLKEGYKSNPSSAIVTLTTSAELSDGISCKLSTGKAAHQVAGLHPLAGGKGDQLCSGDMLLEALVACTGVTLRAVATSMEIPLASGTITVEGDLNFAGTLGVDRNVPVGFTAIRLKFDLDAGETDKTKLDKLIQLTERYCVVLQSLTKGVPCSSELLGSAAAEKL